MIDSKTTRLELDTTGTRISQTDRDEYHTIATDTSVIPTEDGEFILHISRGMYDNETWESIKTLRVSDQITLTRDHAEMLVKLFQKQLAA